jgi:hypothetical protein
MVENILRGYNPGGRMYAVLALLTTQRKGTQLSAESQKSIRTVLHLDIRIESYSGLSPLPQESYRNCQCLVISAGHGLSRSLR